MKCQELLQQLAAWDDGVLPDAVCQELQRHLDRCEPCQSVRADLESLVRICRGCEPPRLPPDLRRRLEDQLSGRSR
jgi:anti-sigma factor (TIGR02949 family)